MSRKLYAALLPLAAVVAFVAVPAAAQAAPEWEACKAKTGGKFTTDACSNEGTPRSFEWETVGTLGSALLTYTKNVGGTVAKLENEGKTLAIECKKVEGYGWVWNKAGRGRDINELEFKECKGSGELTECTVAEPFVVEASTRLELEGVKIFNKFFPVDNGPVTEITLSGAKCPMDGTFPIEGTMSGEMNEHSNKEKISGNGLVFIGEKFEYTGELEVELSPSKGGVRVS